MTRRILRSFDSMEEDGPAPAYERASARAPLDSWDMPPRRDTEEMMARVGRSEAESNEAWRRIEDQLRGRLDYSEGNRTLSRTALEMNISAREQAQAVDQLSLNVIALNERLDLLERSAAHEGIKEAVRALHQGLSRLADQITTTANNSAAQLVQLTTNLEQLAGRVGQVRLESESADLALGQRIDGAERAIETRLLAADKALGQRIDGAERAIETRLLAAEKASQFNASALGHALTKIEAGVHQRTADQAEHQRSAAQHAQSLHRLEETTARLEMRLSDAQFEHRLGGIEHSLGGLIDRLELLEKDHIDLLAELRAKVLRPAAPPATPAPQLPSAWETLSLPEPLPARDSLAGESLSSLLETLSFADELAADEPPGMLEIQPVAESMSSEEPLVFESLSNTSELPPADEALACEPDFPNQAEAIDAFTLLAVPQDTSLDIAADNGSPDSGSDPVTLDCAETVAEPAPENFLVQAHRSAQAASQKAESERRGDFTAFRWGQTGADAEKAKPRYRIAIAVALIVALAAAAALVLSQPARAPEQAAANSPLPAIPAYNSDTRVVVNGQAVAPAAPQPAAPAATPQNGKIKSSARIPLDRVIQMANSGNPITLTILGLRALDGTGGAAVSLPDAVRFLSQAAEKGQAVAQYRLGTLYERGQGVAADPVMAAHWYEMAANQGSRKAMHNLAVSYADGATGKKDMVQAARWFAKAAALGLSDSQFNLAVLYESGAGVPQSLADAYKWYAIAASTGDSESKARIGLLQSRLSAADKVAASKAVAAFHAAPLNRAANVPPEPADLGT